MADWIIDCASSAELANGRAAGAGAGAAAGADAVVDAGAVAGAAPDADVAADDAPEAPAVPDAVAVASTLACDPPHAAAPRNHAAHAHALPMATMGTRIADDRRVRLLQRARGMASYRVLWRRGLLALALVGCGSGATSSLVGHPIDTADASASDASVVPVPEAGGDGTTAPDATSPAPVDGGVESGPDSSPDTDATPALGPLVAYASGYGPNIDVYAVDASTGALSPTSSVAAFGPSPSFLAVDRAAAHLYAVDESTAGRVGAYSIAPATGALTFLNAVSSGGDGPPFVTLDRSGAFALVANYGDGSVSVLPVQADGSLAAATTTLSVGTNAHMFVTDLSNRFAFVPCLGSDYVAQFLFDASTGALTPNAVPHVSTAAGAGPRHLAFHPDGKVAYLINETNSTLSTYALDPDAGTLSELQTISTILDGFTGTNTAAEVWVHPSGAWVLGSNRGDDSLVVFSVDASTGELTPVGSTKSGGTTPRDFTVDATGTLVYAANEGTGNVVPFRFDAATGALTATASAVDVTMASFVGVVRLP